MALGTGKCLHVPLLVINFIFYFISACIAGWGINKFMNGDSIGNSATLYFLQTTLVASMVGLASVFAGIHHVRVWGTDSLSAAHATALIAWLLTLLAMGFACKEIHVCTGLSGTLRALEAFIIILAATELLYLLSLHAGILHASYGPTYRNNTVAGNTGVIGTKDANYGTPAASAV
ncbi:unnamed protein product [Sphagnum compactum]